MEFLKQIKVLLMLIVAFVCIFLVYRIINSSAPNDLKRTSYKNEFYKITDSLFFVYQLENDKINHENNRLKSKIDSLNKRIAINQIEIRNLKELFARKKETIQIMDSLSLINYFKDALR